MEYLIYGVKHKMLILFNIRRLLDSQYVLKCIARFRRKMAIVNSFPTEKHVLSAMHGFKLIIIFKKQVVDLDCKMVGKRFENIEEIRAFSKLVYSS